LPAAHCLTIASAPRCAQHRSDPPPLPRGEVDERATTSRVSRVRAPSSTSPWAPRPACSAMLVLLLQRGALTRPRLHSEVVVVDEEALIRLAALATFSQREKGASAATRQRRRRR